MAYFMAATYPRQVHRHHAVPHGEFDIDHVGIGTDRAHVGTDVEQQVDSVVSRYGVSY